MSATALHPSDALAVFRPADLHGLISRLAWPVLVRRARCAALVAERTLADADPAFDRMLARPAAELAADARVIHDREIL